MPDPHSPASHSDRCAHTGCRWKARWHIDCGRGRCGNYCGTHTRVLQRRSLWSAVCSTPIIRRRVR
jgi:hypothetical protein